MKEFIVIYKSIHGSKTVCEFEDYIFAKEFMKELTENRLVESYYLCKIEIKKPLTREVIEQARQKYLNYNLVEPEQFNLSYSQSKGWNCEFCRFSNWGQGFTTWISGQKALDIFFSCDPDLIDVSSWDEDWNNV